MCKFCKIFSGLLAVLLVVSLGLPGTVFARDDSEKLISGYYGIDRETGLIGQVEVGTGVETFLQRIVPNGELSLSAGVATGSVLSLSAEGEAVDELTLVMLSDVNGDGGFSVTDMLMVKSNLLRQQEFTEAQKCAADVNGDGNVSITDFLQMKSKVLKIMDFTVQPIGDAPEMKTVLLTPGQTYAFGPTEVPGPTEPTEPSTEPSEPEPTENPTEPSVEATEPEEDPTEPTEDPTEPSTESTEPAEDPSEPSTEPTEPSQEEPSQPAETTPEAPVMLLSEAKLPLAVIGDAVTWEKGVLTAVKEGTAMLTWGEEALVVTVCSQGLTITLPEMLAIGPGASSRVQYTLSHPVSADVTFTVSDPSVAQVDENGVLTALAEGTTTVTATLDNGASTSMPVRVIELIETLTLSNDSIKVKNGSSKTLVASFAPASSPEKLIWSSSDTSIATVDQNGLVTGLKNGTVTITCTTEFGQIKASCKVKVCNLIQVALTYDDGPSSAYTEKLLDLLKKYDVDVTFFMVGNRIRTAPKAVQRMVAEGHELGYHTWAHTFFFNMSQKEIEDDLNMFQEKLMEVCGQKATVFRAPGGNITGTALSTIPMPHIMWSVDTRDWETRNTTAVKNAIIGGLRDGAIILVHDIHQTTYLGSVQALEYIFKNDLDVEFLTVTELLSRDGTPPEAGKTYYKG